MDPINEVELLPVRVEQGLQLLVDAAGIVAGTEPVAALRLELTRPVAAPVAALVSVRSKAGIPLASAVVQVRPDDRVVVTPPLRLLAMEGYSHLKTGERQAVERRVWSRRAYVTLERA